MPPVKTGVEAYWDNKNFQKGFGEFMKDVAQANKAAGGTAAPIQQMGGAAASATGSMAGMGAMAVAGGMALFKLAEMAVNAATKLIGIGISSVLAAARVQELTLVMQLLGQRAGYSQQELTNMTNEIRAQGIQTDVALNLMAQFSRYSLDMADASDLAAVAQNAAVLSMQDSSQTLDGLLKGILTYNQETLRANGINVNVQKSFEDYAKTIGKTKDALTEQEKAQAVLNGVIEAGVNIQGVYDTAQQTAGKQARSLSRYIFDLKAVLGAPFLGAFSNIIEAITKFVKAMITASSEGGRLYPILLALGTIASFITGAFKSVSDSLSNWLAPASNAKEAMGELAGVLDNEAAKAEQAADKIVTKFSSPFIDAAADAIEWGAKIMINLASGLIKGAMTAITAALNWISDLLTGWLKPGSPPKIIPNIDKYGAATMNEYLNGFTKADFSALDAIQGSLKSVFGLLVDQGKMTQKELGPMFAAISKDIIKAMASGSVDEGLFKKIRKAGGAYGKELEQLARDQIALAQAENQVKAAEEALAAARKRELETGKEVNLERMKYNRMLRGGASQADLKAQLAKVNASEAAHDAAVAEADTAEQSLETAQANIDVLREQAALQQQLLEQLLEIAQAQVQPPETPGGAGGEGGGVELPDMPEMPGGDVDLSGLEDKFKEAVDRIRQNIIDKLKDVWQDLVKLWNEKMGPAIDKLKAAWERFKQVVAPIVDYLKAKWEAFKNWLAAAIPGLLAGLQSWWQQHGQNVIAIVKFLWDSLVAGAKQLWENLKMLWSLYGDDIIKIAEDVWSLIKTVVETGIENIGLIIDAAAALIEGDWDEFWKAMKGLAENWWEQIKAVLTVAWDIIKLAWKVLLDYLEWYWTTVWNGIKKVADIVWTALKSLAGVIWKLLVEEIERNIEDLAKFLEGAWKSIETTADTIWNIISGLAMTLWSGITSLIMGLVTTLQSGLEGIWNGIKSTAETIWSGIKGTANTVWIDIKDFIKNPIGEVQSWLTTAWNTIKAKADEIWGNIKSSLSGIVQEMSNEIERIAGGIATKIKGFVSDMVGAGKALIQGLIDGVGQMAGALWEAVKGVVDQAIQKLKESLGLASPSKVFIKFGIQTIQGLEKGIKLSADLPKNALMQAVGDMIPPSNPVPVMAGPSYRTMNMTNNIYPSNNMDLFAMERFIEKTVIRALRR